MDFGRLRNVDRIRFELPKDDPRSADILKTTLSTRSQIYIGAPIWTCASWTGRVFPKGTPPKNYLHAYGQQFNTVELNSSFYQVLAREQINGWRDAVPEDFRFAPKVHQSISHFDDPKLALAEASRFIESIAQFNDRLGLCFIQLPPHVGIDRISALKPVLQKLSQSLPLSIELRHPSWFTRGVLVPQGFDLFSELGIATVITDVAGRRDVLHSSLTAPKALVRFVGNEGHPSDEVRLKDWAKKVSHWVEQGIEEVYFIIHQPTQNEVPEQARYFADEIFKISRTTIRSCSPLPGEQMSFF